MCQTKLPLPLLPDSSEPCLNSMSLVDWQRSSTSIGGVSSCAPPPASFPKHSALKLQRARSAPPSLTFNPEVRVRMVPNIDDLSTEEKQDTWYSVEDYQLIRRREKCLMKKVALQRQQQALLHEIQDQENRCSTTSILPPCPSLIHKVLALETREERDARCQTIRDVQAIVLCEQQQHDGDAERLAALYAHISSASAMEARDRGMVVEIVLRNLELVEDSSGIARPLAFRASERRWTASYCSTETSSTCNHSVVERSTDLLSSPPLSPILSSPTSVVATSPRTRRVLPIDVVEAAVKMATSIPSEVPPAPLLFEQ